MRRKGTADWFVPRNYPHFDKPVMDREIAAKIVASFIDAPDSYRFLPLISFEMRARRWRTDPNKKRARQTWKKRPLAYCSNRDAHVFAAMAQELAEKYEAALDRTGLQQVVVGYRKGRSNVTTAKEAFEEITRLGSCTAIALDLEKFFDTIPHRTLKHCWEDVIGGGLPDHHYAAFRALTRFSTVDRSSCLKRLGLPARTPSRNLKRPLCGPEEFRNHIRGLEKNGGLVRVNPNDFGIPQGTPLSAIAANMAMFRFDQILAKEAMIRGGTYRRYSDDILLICPPENADDLLSFLKETLGAECKGVSLNDQKTRRVVFAGTRLAANMPHLQYLGFLFNGERAVLRPSTVSRYYGRMRRAVRSTQYKLKEEKFLRSPKGGRLVLQRRKLLHQFTHLGRDSLLRTYIKLSGNAFGQRVITRQLRHHLRRFSDLLDKP
jgi:hypothetical protein